MAGFNFELGRSNNMVAAEAAGKITIGRWARRHGVSARAALEVMRPHEAHHTGTGRRGRSKLTYVIERDAVPTPEQLEAMKAWDRGERASVQGWYTTWRTERGDYGRKRWVPVLAVYRGDEAAAPRGLNRLNDEDYAEAAALAGRDLKPWALSWREVRV